jgi:hypothetical protein
MFFLTSLFPLGQLSNNPTSIYFTAMSCETGARPKISNHSPQIIVASPQGVGYSLVEFCLVEF